MTHHGIDQSKQTIAQFVELCECLKSAEQIPSGTSLKWEQDKKDKETHRTASSNCKHGARCNGAHGQREKIPNGCWIVCKQLGLLLSDTAKAHFQKQRGIPKEKHKTYSEKEVNTMISEEVEVAI